MEDDLFENRIIFVSGPVDTELANHVIRGLLLLNARNSRDYIDIYINSPGGSVVDGLAILDTMMCIEAPIRTVCLGQATSMAAWILAAGTKGERYATPNARIMLHQIATGIEGDTAHIKSYVDHLNKLQQLMIELMHQFSGQERERITRDIEVDFYLGAAEAREYGLIDKILEPKKKY